MTSDDLLILRALLKSGKLYPDEQEAIEDLLDMATGMARYVYARDACVRHLTATKNDCAGCERESDCYEQFNALRRNLVRGIEESGLLKGEK